MALREHTEGEAQGARQLGRSKEDYETYTHADALRALARQLEMAETARSENEGCHQSKKNKLQSA
ncbi:MAG: hypothetical protein ABSE96_02740 [Terracidiphilus sp.]|jgi:hypothetical protein